MNLETLIAKAAEDEASFKLLYDTTVKKIFRYFMARTGSRDTSIDLTQDVYIALYKGLSRFKYQSDEQFFGYLFTIAKRIHIRSWHSNKDTVPLLEEYDLEDIREEKEDYRKLLSEVEKLKDKQKMVIKLRYFSDLSFKEIASALSISENYAKVLHSRAIQSLQILRTNYE
jgi:RNA polymerase sigma-70 factor (ECF subfamily)